MMIGMTILAFVLGYPLFMVFVYFTAKVIFTPTDKIVQEQAREREQLLQRAKRVPRAQRLAHA
jgi:hypothetical protein